MLNKREFVVINDDGSVTFKFTKGNDISASNMGPVFNCKL